MSARGRKLVKAHKSVRVWATFTVTGATSAIPPAQVTLKRPAKRATKKHR